MYNEGGDLAAIRTRDPQLRRLLLYPLSYETVSGAKVKIFLIIVFQFHGKSLVFRQGGQVDQRAVALDEASVGKPPVDSIFE